jgi:translocation and assembly module TamA
LSFSVKQLVFSILTVLISAQSALALTVQLVGDADENLKAQIKGASLLFEQAAEEAKEDQDTYSAANADYARILGLLYDRGYFGATISIKIDGQEAANIEPISAPSAVKTATIKVTTGPLFTFGKTRIEPLAPATKLPTEFVTGQPASLSTLKSAASAAVSGWRDQGYAKAEVTGEQVTANHQSSTLNAALMVSTGEKLKFGKLVVSGNKRVRKERILKITGLPEGQVFSPEELDDSIQRLRRTGAFQSVAVTEADEIGPGQTMDIYVTVAEQRRRRFGVGGDIGTSDGLSLRAFWMHRNLLGGAENLRIEGEISGIGGDKGGENYKLTARFERPATFGVDKDLYVLAEIEQEDEVNYFSRQATVGAGLKYIASNARTYEYGIGFTSAETRDAFGSQKYVLFVLPTRLTRDYRNDLLDATKGYFLVADAKPFLALKGSDNGVRTYVDYRYYKTIGSTKPLTLAFRGQFGSVAGPSLRDSPANFLFYSGGGGTVRGQPYQSLGVDVGGGDQVGGRSFLGVSLEARFRATETIGVVGFFDYGFIGVDSLPKNDAGRSQSGAGLGVRYHTPIGPIRFDVAVPVSGPNPSSKFEIYIGIGQAF